MKEKMYEYNLIDQYYQAFGYDYRSLENNDLKKEFLEWLKERTKMKHIYLNYLYSLKKDIIERTTAEIGKTDDDTMSKLEFMDNLVISSYNINDIDDSRIIPAKMKVKNEEIYLDFFNRVSGMFLPRNLNLIMTHNPYNIYSVLNWEDLHNSGNYDIAIGIFGSIYDKDIKNKINLLTNIKEKIIDGNYIYSVDTNNDCYYATLISDRPKTLKK